MTEDVFGVAVGSFWTLYNMGLIGGVIALSRRPPQKRQSCRFRIAVPIEVAFDIGGANRLRPIGMTSTVSESGCTLVWPSTLPQGTRWPFSLHFGLTPVRCQGEVVWAHPRQDGSRVAHGVRFFDERQETVDLLNDAVVEMVFPELFDRLSQPSLTRQLSSQVTSRLGTEFVSRRKRHLRAVPVRVTMPTGEFVVATRDLSASGVRLDRWRAAAGQGRGRRGSADSREGCVMTSMRVALLILLAAVAIELVIVRHVPIGICFTSGSPRPSSRRVRGSAFGSTGRKPSRGEH